jgi:VWFA-related protein
MTGKKLKTLKLTAIVALFLMVVTAWSQQDKKQDIPDAPSATQPPMPFPADTAPASKDASPPAENEPPRKIEGYTPPPFPEPSSTPNGVTTMPPASQKGDDSNTREDLYKIVSNVNFVQVPVTVKDENGRMVNGLVPKDFAVYENGEKQKMTYFTSDPFPLSAAVIVDLGMPDSAVQQVNQTFSSLEGAFSPFDEVSLYTYSGTVTQVSDFGTVGQRLNEVLGELKTKRGRNDGVPVTSGPFSSSAPIVNGVPVNQPVPVLVTPPKEAHVINDAILKAALDLNKRERGRRKIIFVISDGRERGSTAGYNDVLKVLLTNGIVVYGVGVGSTALPVYGKLQKFHIPRLGTGDILPKYASATGGELFTELSHNAIGEVYARAVGDARNQYTLGYMTKAAPGGYREIEVRVARPDCSSYDPPCVRTFAKTGYYPLPPRR